MRTIRTLLLCVYGLCLLASSLAAQGRTNETLPLDMQPRVLAKGLEGHITALRDPGGTLSLDQAILAVETGAFAPVTTRTPDFGFTPDTIWLHVPLVNGTPQPDWRMRLRENFFQEFTAWHLPATGSPTLLEHQDESTGFASRRVQWPELVVAFRQPPDTKGALLLRLRSGGSTEAELSLFDAPTFAAWADRMTARNFIYYGMLIFLIVAAIATWAATRHGIFIAYASYALAGLLFVMHGDGNAFRYLWPDAPGFNAFATVPLGTGIIVFGANFARQFLQTTLYHPVFDRMLLGTIWITLITAGASAVVDTQLIKKLLVLMAFGSVLLFLASGLNAARTRLREVRFYVIAWSGAVVSSAIMTGRHWLGLEISEEIQFDSMRIVLVLDAALMGLAILDRFNSLRRSRSDALETSLAAAERNLSLSRRLQTLEQRYAQAADLARHRERRVADTIHDLRQPLHALRLNVQSLLADGGETPMAAPAQSREIEDTFSFLEQLVTEELDQFQSANPAPVAEEVETVDLSEVLSAVAKMFAPDAKAKGLTIRVIDTDARLRLPAVAVMRILSNLVSNAVRYTGTGRIVMGAQRLPGGGLRIEVHDTGPGMSADDFAAALPRNARLKQTSDQPGHGLGLAIVAKTCAEHGLRFELLPGRSSGTSLGVILEPRHLA